MGRPWYYTHVDAHPTDPDVVYINNESFFRSDDGGHTLVNIPTPHGDNHDMWFNPDHPEIFIQSNDGGANVTFNGGRTWSTQYNQPTAEFYTVTADDQFPYRLYAPQQDNTTISVPSRITRGLTPSEDWFAGPGCETGPVVVDPRDPNVLYGACKGWVSRLNRSTNQLRQVWIWPQEPHALPNSELKYREQWVSQIRFSPHDPSVIYHTSQHVHVTRNEGQDWEVISPDLTRWEEHRELHVDPPGGPLTYDQTGVEVYGTIFAFEESPFEPGLFWAGSDDGAVHISRDGGASWADVTPPGLPLHSTVNEIVLSPHDAGRAFAVIQRYRLDDFHPYIYRTDDYGTSWTLLTDGTNGIPADHPTRALQEDHAVKGLLYAGTEFGVFVSFDDGEHWQSFQQNLPRTPVMDLLVKESDLIVATQGRALWILDDLTPLHQIEAASMAPRGAFLFAPRPAYRMRLQSGRRGGVWAQNPPAGAAIHYGFAGDVEGEVTLEIRDAAGELVRVFTSSGPRTKEQVFQAMREPLVTIVGTPRVRTTRRGYGRHQWSSGAAGHLHGYPAPGGRMEPDAGAGGAHGSAGDHARGGSRGAVRARHPGAGPHHPDPARRRRGERAHPRAGRNHCQGWARGRAGRHHQGRAGGSAGAALQARPARGPREPAAPAHHRLRGHQHLHLRLRESATLRGLPADGRAGRAVRGAHGTTQEVVGSDDRVGPVAVMERMERRDATNDRDQALLTSRDPPGCLPSRPARQSCPSGSRCRT